MFCWHTSTHHIHHTFSLTQPHLARLTQEEGGKQWAARLKRNLDPRWRQAALLGGCFYQGLLVMRGVAAPRGAHCNKKRRKKCKAIN